MNRVLSFTLVALYALFLGSQITEGCLLVPYWQSLSTNEFYSFYEDLGPAINQFYTVLTIMAVLITLGVSVYCLFRNRKAFIYSLTSSVFSALVILLFYIYFKGVNQSFFQEALKPSELKNELSIWAFWHWVRVMCEFLSLVFLVITLLILDNPVKAQAYHKQVLNIGST